MNKSGESSKNNSNNRNKPLSNCKTKKLEYKEKEILTKALKLSQEGLKVQISKDLQEREMLRRELALRIQAARLRNGCNCGSQNSCGCNGHSFQRPT
jgi:hypothetical protein